MGRACRGPLIGPRTRTVSHPRPGPQRCLALASKPGLLRDGMLLAPGWAPSPLHRPCGLGWALIFPLRRRSLSRDALRHPLRTAFRSGRIIPFASAVDGLVPPPRSAVEFVHPVAFSNRFQTIMLQLSAAAIPPKRDCNIGRLQCFQNLDRCVRLSLIFRSLRLDYQTRSSLSTHKCCASFPSRASEK